MLTDQTITLIKATTPLMQEHGEAIATKMYDIMFAQYPQTKLLFSKAPLNQPKILARSVIIYSQHIDNIDTIHEVLEKIAHKHVSVDVHPGHYPMLGHSFIQAMREVLGKSVSEEVIMAWKDAYFYFAELLIEREQALVAKHKATLTQS
ncbi:MAG: globin domain-containing protein [Thiotrichaceae bacterium]